MGETSITGWQIATDIHDEVLINLLLDELKSDKHSESNLQYISTDIKIVHILWPSDLESNPWHFAQR